MTVKLLGIAAEAERQIKGGRQTLFSPGARMQSSHNPSFKNEVRFNIKKLSIQLYMLREIHRFGKKFEKLLFKILDEKEDLKKY